MKQVQTSLGQLNNGFEASRMLIVPDRRFEGLCVKLNIEDDVGDCQGTYLESLMKIRHALAEKG